MILSGIDYSLCGPAICVYVSEGNETKFSFNNCNFYFLTKTKKYATLFGNNIHGERLIDWNHDCERYRSIADWACEKVMGSNIIGLEGYSMGSKGKVFNIAENTGVLKYKLWEEAYPIEIFAPTEVKKFATGKGNADKKAMHTCFQKDTGINLNTMISPDKGKITSPVSDIVDSYYICKLMHKKWTEKYV